MLQTEEEGIAKMKQVIAFATDDDCRPLFLVLRAQLRIYRLSKRLGHLLWG